MNMHQSNTVKAYRKDPVEVLVLPQVTHEDFGKGNGPALEHFHHLSLLCWHKANSLHAVAQE